jgi:flagellar biosynthesis protein FliR
MLTFTYAQVDGWMALYLYPAFRVLGLLATAPLFSSRSTPARVRLAVGLLITLAVAPALPPTQGGAPEVGSGLSLVVLAYNMMIGVCIGFIMRLVMAAVDVAGEMIGLQMGLSFAVFFDPDAGGQTSVVAEFLGLLALIIFLTANAHLMMIDVLVSSFQWLPPGVLEIRAQGWGYVGRLGAALFATGLLIALPIVAALLTVNVAMGILTRAAPQLNILAVGFPITLSAGFVGLLVSIHAFEPVMRSLIERGIRMISTFLQELAPLGTVVSGS